MSPTPKSPSSGSPGSPDAGDPYGLDNPEETAKRLLTAAEKIMLAISRDETINLNHPVDMLALHLLGPAMQRAMGMDHAELSTATANILDIALTLDVPILRALLRQATR